MLRISGLRAHYGGISALAGIDLEVAKGEIVALLGSNGAGKSTLLGVITASAPCEAHGSVLLDDVELLGKSTEGIIRAGVVLVPEGRQLFAELTVHENLLMGAYLSGEADMPQSTTDDFARALLPLLVDVTESTRRIQPGWPVTGTIAGDEG